MDQNTLAIVGSSHPSLGTSKPSVPASASGTSAPTTGDVLADKLREMMVSDSSAYNPKDMLILYLLATVSASNDASPSLFIKNVLVLESQGEERAFFLSGKKKKKKKLILTQKIIFLRTGILTSGSQVLRALGLPRLDAALHRSTSFDADETSFSASNGVSHVLESSRYAREFDTVSVLGTGSFGAVFKAKNRLDGNEYAVKKIVFRAELNASSATNSNACLEEVRVLATLTPHRNVCRYYGAWLESHWTNLGQSRPEHVGLLLTDDDYDDASSVRSSSKRGGVLSDVSDESGHDVDEDGYAYDVSLHIQMALHGNDGYTLRDFINRNRLSDPAARTFLTAFDPNELASQAIRGLAHVHDFGVVHRDVKPENFFLCDDGETLVLGDFGLSTDVGDDSTKTGGTASYSCPSSASASRESDAFALGLTLLELFVEFETGMERALAFRDVRSGTYAIDRRLNCGPELKKCIENMLRIDPCKRESPCDARRRVSRESRHALENDNARLRRLVRDLSAENEALKAALASSNPSLH